MNFSERVERGHYDNLLLGQDPAGDSLLLGLDAIEEAWTPKSLSDHNKDYITASSSNGFDFDLAGTWRYVRYLYSFCGPVKNITNNLSMLIGTPEIKFDDESPEAKKWKAVSITNKFPWRWGHIIRNSVLTNDFFTIVFKSKNPEASPEKCKVRHLPPDYISKVETDDKDPETIKGYKVADAHQATVKEFKPEETVHHIIDKVGNDTRGIPIFNACLKEIKYYHAWLQDLYYLGHTRARFPVVREVMGGATKTQSEADRYQYLPGPGRMLVQNQGLKLTYPPTYSGTGDAGDGLKAFLQAISLAVNLPLFLVTSDYTNNSLASTLSADSPTIKLIRWYRVQFEEQFRQIIYRIMGESEFEIDWPPIVERDIKALADAYAIGIEKGAVSAQTMCAEVFGLNWDQEKDRIVEESKREADLWRMNTQDKENGNGRNKSE